QRLWDAVLTLIRYISPGLWLFWKGVPHPGYHKARQQMDTYLYRIIQLRREQLQHGTRSDTTDMLSGLIASGMSDNLIRDQLMTMLIAGHDTGTAALAWTLYLLGKHPDVQQKTYEEVQSVIGNTTP